MAKDLNQLAWIEELLPPDYFRKKMFGGFAYYIDDKLYLVIFESEGNREYRGQKFNFEIWNGCMFPVDRVHHEDVLRRYPYLIHHPVLPKWLYLPLETEDFDSRAQELMAQIRRQNPTFGTFPKQKNQKLRKTKNKKIERFTRRGPQMFGDEPVEAVFHEAKKISDLKNLGPESEKSFLKAGLKTPQQVRDLGWKKVMEMLYKSNPKHGHTLFAYAVIGALQNTIWNGISEDDKREAREHMKFLKAQFKPKSPIQKKQNAKPGRSKLKKAALKKAVQKKKAR